MPCTNFMRYSNASTLVRMPTNYYKKQYYCIRQLTQIKAVLKEEIKRICQNEYCY